jgi:hypothetical protein
MAHRDFRRLYQYGAAWIAPLRRKVASELECGARRVLKITYGLAASRGLRDRTIPNGSSRAANLR